MFNPSLLSNERVKYENFISYFRTNVERKFTYRNGTLFAATAQSLAKVPRTFSPVDTKKTASWRFLNIQIFNST
jgi:hypothetical protein